MATNAGPDERAPLIDSGALEAISFECECGCRVEIPWSAEPKDKGKGLACPCCGAAIPGAPKVWKAFETLAWAIGDGQRIRFRLSPAAAAAARALVATRRPGG